MLLNISHVSFGYIPNTTVLQDLSLNVDAGEVVGLIGPNGSGKSTLIKCVADLLAIRSGQITIDFHPHTSVSAKSSMLLLASNDDMPEFLTGSEFVHLIHRMHGKEIDTGFVQQLFERYAMKYRKDSLIEDYSHGMRKKLQLITAISLRPRLTIIDETLNGVDLDSLYRSEHDIRSLSETGGVLVCSHDFRFLEAVVNRVAILQDGELVHDSPLGEVRSAYGSIDSLTRKLLFGPRA